MQFPLLSTGAVSQYSTPMGVASPVGVVRFVDGAGQRFQTTSVILRRWLINVTLLTEDEVAVLERFFQSTQGEYSVFDFPDPFSGTIVSNCRIGAPQLATEYLGTDLAAAGLWVIETNG